MTAYQTLAARFERAMLFKSSADMLEWDSATMMPSGAIDLRSAQLAQLRVAALEPITQGDMEELLARAEEERAAGAWERANVAAMRRAYVHAAAVPPSLVEARSRACSRSEMAWRGARSDNDFATFAPHLEEVLRLTREVGAAKADRLSVSPYDALLDEYEPGGRSERLDGIFATLARELPPLVDAIAEHQASHPLPPLPPGPFPAAKQAELARRLADRIGFDFSRGRLDTSTHPFCGGAAEDVRITTRYDERDFLSSVMSVIHETGHALYELGLPREWVRQPVGQAVGMAIHESQSLLVEMQASRSPEFFDFFAPLAHEIFGGPPEAFRPEVLRSHSLRVRRGFIRVDADEATYPLHVVLRYRLERAMLSGDLAVRDLPGAWGDGMKSLLGVVPPTDREGCLQDIHWPSGAFGYFPTYTMGAIAAAQLFRAACAADSDVRPALGRGDFAPLVAFVRAKVHGEGSRHDTDTVLERATGSKLDERVLLDHLKRRYLGR